MRQIKIRIWDTQENKRYKPIFRAYKGELHDLLLTTRGDLMEHTISGLRHESMFPGRYIKSQRTGLKDIVGKDIYQGDVVIFSDVGGVFIHGCEVVWHDCSWCVSVLDERILPLPSDYGKEGIEVIGNKRENPDLLNKN